MKTFDIELQTKNNTITLVPLSDLHIGDSNTNTKLIKETIDFVKNTKDCYLIFNGDLINNAIINSKSNIYEDILTPKQQQEKLIEILSPIKDKIILLASGNHEFRTNKTTGNDPLDYICSKLNINNYADNSWFIKLRFGEYKTNNRKNIYTIYGTHGFGNGGAISSTVKALEKMADIVSNADLYIHSHTHQFVTFSKPIEFYNAGADRIMQKTRTFVNTPSFVEYGGYAERLGTSPQDTTPIKITISFKQVGNTMMPYTAVTNIK